MKRIATLMLTLLAAGAWAQQPDKSQQQMKANFAGFRQQATETYGAFRDKCNRDYATFMRKAWESFYGEPAVPAPKDEMLPPKQSQSEQREAVAVNQAQRRDMPAPEPRPEPVEEVVELSAEEVGAPPATQLRKVFQLTDVEEQKDAQPEQPAPAADQPQEQWFGFSLYGTPLYVRLSDKHRFRVRQADEYYVSTAWQRLSSKRYNNVLHDCLRLRDDLQLCDWAYLRMLDELSAAFLGRGSNEAELLKAWLFCQSGYKMRLAFENGHLIMLYGSRYVIYDRPAWRIGGIYYYSDCDWSEPGAEKRHITAYNRSFPSERTLSLSFADEQKISLKRSDRRTLQSSDTPWQRATVVENANLMHLYDDYPVSTMGCDELTRWAIYANTSICTSAQNELYPQLRRMIAGKTPFEAVDVILHWMQTSLQYKYDDEVWGRDRAFFPDETLFYPYQDCEDRAILFTRIVRDLLGLDCALVMVPGHLLAAVSMDPEVKGDSFDSDGKHFLFCDPTCTGAPVGYLHEDFHGQDTYFIILNNK